MRRLPLATDDKARGRAQRAVLLGPIQQENLALQYLAAAARKAGHEAEIVPYSYRSDLDTALRATLARAPDLVGLGIAFQNNIEDYIAFMLALRERGYTGHLTCGGHVPTFCYRELLRDVPGLDTVVRHDGEQTLVAMLDALSRGEPPEDMPGLVWRTGHRLRYRCRRSSWDRGTPNSPGRNRSNRARAGEVAARAPTYTHIVAKWRRAPRAERICARERAFTRLIMLRGRTHTPRTGISCPSTSSAKRAQP